MIPPDWTAVQKELVAAGVAHTDRAVSMAKAAGLSASVAMAIIQGFDRSRFGPGALVNSFRKGLR